MDKKRIVNYLYKAGVRSSFATGVFNRKKDHTRTH